MKAARFFVVGILCIMIPAAGGFAQDSEKSADSAESKKIDMRKQTFRLLLTTGEFYTGKVAGIKGDTVFLNTEGYCPAAQPTREIKPDKGKVKIPVKNIIDISPLAEGQDPMIVPENLEHYIKNGKAMLEGDQPEIAEMLFRLGIYFVPEHGPKAVKAVYKAADKDLPDSLKNTKEIKDYWQYRLPNPGEVLSEVAWAIERAKEMKKIAPSTHILETEHFIICSAWARSNDSALKKIYENLYKKLCSQFNIDKDENIWVGKLPVFAFWKKNEFISYIGGPLGMDGPLAQIGGFCGKRPIKDGVVTFVALGPVERGSKAKSKTWFFELLVHETTHGFVGRYINSNNIPNWVNEGIAEMMATTLVPNCWAVEKCKQASQSVGRGQDPSCIFDCQNIPMNVFSYGAAQSIVRYLVSADRKKFIKFVINLKDGMNDSEALEKSYGFDRKKLVTNWSKSLARKTR